MKSILLLPTLLLALAASPAYAQTKDKDDKSGGTASKAGKGKPASTQFRPETATEREQRQRRAEEAARAERNPPAPLSKPPSSPSSSSPSGSSGKGR